MEYILNPGKIKKNRNVGLAVFWTIVFLVLAGFTIIIVPILALVFILLIGLTWFLALRPAVSPVQVSPERGEIYEVIPKKTDISGQVLEWEWIKIDLLTYLSPEANGHKANRNCLIIGTAGMGKTELAIYLTGLMKQPEIVFSFKGKSFYRIGIPILDVSKAVPQDLFDNPDDFVEAFKVAFPINSVGIAASQASSVLRKALIGSRSWDQVFKNLNKPGRDNIENSTRNYVLTQLESLSHPLSGSSLENMNTRGGLVFDFSGFNSEDAKTLYAEMILRMLWRKTKNQEIKYTLIVDEVHHFLTEERAKFTIFSEILREIREFSSIWAITQNYSDIDDQVRNQFNTQFCFGTTSEYDLKALGRISGVLAMKVVNLPRYRFVDAKFPSRYYYPVWEAKITKFPEIKPVFVEIEKIDVDYAKEILGRLPDYMSNLARQISIDKKIDRDVAKTKVMENVISLRNANIIEYLDYKNSKNESLKIYSKRGSSKIALGQYISDQVTNLLNDVGIKASNKSSDPNGIVIIDTDVRKIIVAPSISNPKSVEMLLREKSTLLVLPNEVEKNKFKDSPFYSQILLIPELLSVVQKSQT